MLLKLGVYIDRVSRPIRRSFNTIDESFKNYGEEAVITSTDEGNHSPSSLHYDRKEYGAVDIRLPKNRFNVDPIHQELKHRLGKNYDVIRESDHYHIEWDPK